MTVFEKEVPANFVPAAAVRRRELVLFGQTGRKELVGRILLVKGQIIELNSIMAF